MPDARFGDVQPSSVTREELEQQVRVVTEEVMKALDSWRA
jgi:hypothetical protein